MNILGLSFDYHDSAAAILVDGQIVAATQEERISRKKNDSSFPHSAVDFCLSKASLDKSDLDHVVFYEDTLLKFDRIVHASKQVGSRGKAYLDDTVEYWISQSKFHAMERICNELNLPPDKVHHIRHHQSHAAAVYYGSPFNEATVVTLDGVGEYETMTVSKAGGNRITQLYSCEIPHSIGLLYSAFTAYLGFKVNNGEYKVMGMAGFGQPEYYEQIRALVELREDGTFSIAQDCFEFYCPEELPYTEKLVELLGPPRVQESLFDVGDPNVQYEPDSPQELSRKYANVAASVQKVAEDIILHVVERAISHTGHPNLCMAGGVALNSLANGKVQKLVADAGGAVVIHPAAGDAGGALGAALHKFYVLNPNAERCVFSNPYLGMEFTDDDCREALDEVYLETHKRFDSEEELLDTVTQKLVEGAVIGWHQGRTEWGPRALGNRSILANPMLPEMKGIVNEKIKFREPYRPFAPVVPADKASEYFDLPEDLPPGCPEDFMISVTTVAEDKKELLPAITHVDGTARVQLARRETNPRYCALIEAFGSKTGVPVLLNTSFNLRGEPIVNSPANAIQTFAWSGMDYLVLGNYFVWKEV